MCGGGSHTHGTRPLGAGFTHCAGANGCAGASRAERLKEIQKALADKGYFKGEPTGEWNADSVAALKQFQTDRNLTADGKISALSLIGLGLGPKHVGSAALPPVTPAAPPATQVGNLDPSVPK